MKSRMCKPVVTLAIVSSALNMSPLMAKELTLNHKDEVSQSRESIYVISISLSEIANNSLRKEIEKALVRLVTVSRNVESFAKSYDGQEIIEAVLSMKAKVTELEKQQPKVANEVKSKLLGEMLKEGVVVIDDSETERFERVQVSLNDSIVTRLAEDGNLVNVVAGGGTVCI